MRIAITRLVSPSLADAERRTARSSYSLRSPARSSAASRCGRPARRAAVAPASLRRQPRTWVSGSGSPRRSVAGSAVVSTSPSGAWV